MPDAYGNFKGLGYSAKSAEAWERIFGPRKRKPLTRDEVARSTRTAMRLAGASESSRENQDRDKPTTSP